MGINGKRRNDGSRKREDEIARQEREVVAECC